MSGVLLTRPVGTRLEGGRESPDDLRAQFDLLVASGGAVSRSLLRPAPHEIWFSSTSAVAPSLYAHGAGLATLARLMEREGTHGPNLSGWFDTLRARIAASFGAPDTTVLLAPSIAAARDLARAVAYSVHGEAAWELSAGAAESQDMSLEEGDVDIAMRLVDGRPREALAIDGAAAKAARDMSGPLLIHLLDQSISGLSGISRASGEAIAKNQEALTLVDACTMRAPPDRLRADLAEGRMVLISGSTFLGGHGASAALLVPACLTARLRHAAPQIYLLDAALYDMGPEWRALFCLEDAPRLNMGLGLRWSTALAELDRYMRMPEALREAILALFVRKVRTRLSRCEWIEAIDEEGGGGLTPLILHSASLEEADGLRQALAASTQKSGDAVCHLGAPIRLGDQIAALPISASAPMVSDVADRIAKGVSFERAFAPIQRDIDTLFAKMGRIMG